MAREFGPQGIHVAHVIVDGAISGERVRSLFPGISARLGENGMLETARRTIRASSDYSGTRWVAATHEAWS
jgi:hypothetical protein